MEIYNIVFASFGLLFFIPKFIEFFVKFNNSFRGVETKITKLTYLSYWIFGLCWIFIFLLI